MSNDITIGRAYFKGNEGLHLNTRVVFIDYIFNDFFAFSNSENTQLENYFFI